MQKFYQTGNEFQVGLSQGRQQHNSAVRVAKFNPI